MDPKGKKFSNYIIHACYGKRSVKSISKAPSQNNARFVIWKPITQAYQL